MNQYTFIIYHMKRHIYLYIIAFMFSGFTSAHAQTDTATYHLTIQKEMVNKAGKEVMGMTLNGGIPGPTLTFTEGGYAVIYVKNEMDVETSIHWHGLLLPNFYDGVPYLTTPPIEPGHTQKYEFPLRQSGTYWYHSHTMLQEQAGVYGSIVIQPKEKTLEYDKELVVVLSDWTNEKPNNVLRFLRGGTEWYNIKKGTATPLNQVIARGGLGAQMNFWRQRMEGADIADIYYPAFLTNGGEVQEYPDFNPGEKVRLRVINGAASTSFWMTFGGEDPILVSADGLDVVPVVHNKTFIGVAETYDFIVTIPQSGKMEFRSTAQDGSGQTSAFLGKGSVVSAPDVPKPDKIGMMMQMAKMDMKMGAPALKFNPKKDEPYKMMEKWGMKMKGDMEGMADMSKMDDMKEMQHGEHSTPPKKEMGAMDMGKDTAMANHNMADMNMSGAEDMKMEGMQGMSMFSEYNYDYLRSPEKTNYSKDLPVKEVLLNLTGNMQRYIWSMNGIPLSETDKIKINSGEVTRMTFNNLTMMHHPMHLHGHFFRVINENGEYSPLKHTVNVPPMQKITIEFYGSEETGDWFFHCHILYHMMSGMARIVSYDTPRDPRLDEYPVSKIIEETNHYYSFNMLDVASHMSTLNLMTANIRNQFNLTAEFGWNSNLEAEFTYERYLYDYLTVFAGVNIENSVPESLDEMSTTAVAGIRFLTPYLFSLDARIDNELRPRISLGRSIMVFPKVSVFGYYEYQADLGFVNDFQGSTNYSDEVVWSAGAEYILSRNFSIMGSYDNRFGAGGGLSVRF